MGSTRAFDVVLALALGALAGCSHGAASPVATSAADAPTLAASQAATQAVSAALSPPAPTLTGTTGAIPVAVVLVDFTDAAHASSDVALAQSVLADVSAFYAEMSYGEASVAGSVSGPYPIDLPSSTSDLDAIATAALAAALAHGVDLSAAPHVMVACPPMSAFTWRGTSTVGGAPSRTWLNGTIDLQTIAHELGHSLGLEHSHGPTGEYGDTLDIMGAAPSGHMNAFQKERLGWLAPGGLNPIVLVVQSGRLSLDAFETPGGVKALEIANPAVAPAAAFYVEARAATGFDASLAPSGACAGVVIHSANKADPNSSELIAASPNGVALLPGETFHDPASGLTITLVARSDNGADVDVTLGDPTASAAGSLSVEPLSPNEALVSLSRVAIALPSGERAFATGTLDVFIGSSGTAGTVQGTLTIDLAGESSDATIDAAFTRASGSEVALSPR